MQVEGFDSVFGFCPKSSGALQALLRGLTRAGVRLVGVNRRARADGSRAVLVLSVLTVPGIPMLQIYANISVSR